MCKIYSIICVESTSKAAIDELYINSMIKKFAKEQQFEFVTKYIYLNGKGNYNNQKVQKSIQKTKNQYENITGVNPFIIYVLDLDDNYLMVSTKSMNQQIIEYMKKITTCLFGIIRILKK